MPRSSRVETEKRLRQMAIAAVDMQKGIYLWPDGLSPVKPDGKPRMSNRELLRVGGYDPQYKYGGRVLFNDPFYKRQFDLELARRESRLPAIAAAEPCDILKMGRTMLKELEIRLEHDPSSFSTTQLLQFGPTFYKLGLELDARDGDTKNPGVLRDNTKLTQFNTFIGKIVQEMDPEERKDFIDVASRSAEERQDYIKSAIDAADAAGEDDEVTS